MPKHNPLQKKQFNNDLYILQPNKIILAKFPRYTLLMHKIITAIAFELNDAVKLNRTNPNALQLDMFKQNPDTVYLSISYRMILKDATHYDDIRKALKTLQPTPLKYLTMIK